ncbi:MAG: metal ABC transporter permease [Verrucomicrobiota bacterium]
MLNNLIPAFDFQIVVLDPWTHNFQDSLWITLMGFLVSATCGLVGCFVVLRRMALVGDAISHSLLPGIAIAFILTQSRNTLPMMVGAVIAGIVTVALIELIRQSSRIKPDAAIGIVFSTLFAIGVVLISGYADHVDLDTDCVLYGQIEWIPFEGYTSIGNTEIGPTPVIRMAIISAIVILLLVFFYKELLVTSFDAGLAASLGISPAVFKYGLVLVLSVVIVASFESVGVVLVLAMIVFPSTTSLMLTDRLPLALLITVFLSILYTLFGYHLALWLSATTAGAMSVIAGLIFTLAWLFSPNRGLIGKILRRRQIANAPTQTDAFGQVDAEQFGRNL